MGRECCEREDYMGPGTKIETPSNGSEENPRGFGVTAGAWGSCRIVKYVIRYCYPGDDTWTKVEEISWTDCEYYGLPGGEIRGLVPHPDGGEIPPGRLKIRVEVTDECGLTEYDEVTVTIPEPESD